MSTRATYSFFNSKDHNDASIRVYRHWDGDLKGAAIWLLAMFALKPGSHGRLRGDLGTRFIVGNQADAMLVGRLDDYGAAYSYHIDTNDAGSSYTENYDNAVIKVYKVGVRNRLIYHGDLYNFIVFYAESADEAIKWLETSPLTKKNIRKAYNHCKRVAKKKA